MPREERAGAKAVLYRVTSSANADHLAQVAAATCPRARRWQASLFSVLADAQLALAGAARFIAAWFIGGGATPAPGSPLRTFQAVQAARLLSSV